MNSFNVIFKMVIKRGDDDFSFSERDITTIGTDTRFIFDDVTFYAVGRDVNLQYPRERIKSFEASLRD